MAFLKENSREKRVSVSFNQLFGAAALVFLLLVGLLWAKVGKLEKEVKKSQENKAPQKQAQAPKQAPKTKDLSQEEQKLLLKGADAVKGPENAKLTIVEFSEYECPFCKKYVDGSYGEIMKDYGDKIRYVFRDFPLGFHSHAQTLAEAAHCAGEQDKYWEYHDKLFAEKEKWQASDNISGLLADFSGELGLDKAKFADCLDSGKFTAEVKDNLALGQKMGVSGTPSFFINGRRLVGAQPYDAFKKIIEEELKK